MRLFYSSIFLICHLIHSAKINSRMNNIDIAGDYYHHGAREIKFSSMEFMYGDIYHMCIA